MARIGDVLVALRGAVEGPGWHGPSVLEAVADLGEDAARRKVAGASHTCLELIAHIAYWEAMGAHRASFGAIPRPKGAPDWPDPPATVVEAVAHLRHVHERLMQVVAGLTDGDLDREVPSGDGPTSLARMLHAVAAHGAYHGGQIRLLRGITSS